jgi:hypothetical protein
MSEARPVPLSVRPPVAVSLGCHSRSYALPHPDPWDPRTTQAGVLKRFMCMPPDFNEALLAELKKFVLKFIHKHFTPLSPFSDTSFVTWLAKTNYPEWRKAELRKTWEDNEKVFQAPWGKFRNEKSLKKFTQCKSFMKDEFYIQYKPARGINSRHDAFKCAVGPIFKLIEKEVFKYPAFIKYCPVADRPKYISDFLGGHTAAVIATDYSTFEALFVPEIMRSVEFVLYDYMTQFLPQYEWFMSMCEEVLASENTCKYKHFTAKVEGKRMSGEMCTSLGNGFSNLMFTLFMCKHKGCKKVRGVVEGDDGLFTMQGEPPSSKDFEKLGLVIKLERHEQYNMASFCGLIFDTKELANICDPKKVSASFGWSSATYAYSKCKKLQMLLRAKAMSLAHQYKGCPILFALAEYGLKMTKDIPLNRLRNFIYHSRISEWERERYMQSLLKEVTVVPPGPNTRRLMEEKFGIRIDDQVRIEAYLHSLEVLEPIEIEWNVHDHWTDYFQRYSYETDRFDPMLRYPPMIWSEYDGFENRVFAF